MRTPQVEQPSVADQQQNQDAPNQVVNVMPAHHHPLERTAVVHNHAHQQPHPAKRYEERYRSQEHAPPRPVGDGAAHQEAKARQLQQDQQEDDNQAGEGQE